MVDGFTATSMVSLQLSVISLQLLERFLIPVPCFSASSRSFGRF